MRRPSRSRASTVLALAVALLVLVPGCRPLYIPLVPDDGLAEPHPTRLAGGSALELDEKGRPRIELTVIDLPAAGWLAVQWLGPDGREAASESVWVEQGTAEAAFELPDDVALRPGEWRAVVSFGGMLLRQFLVSVP